MTIDEKRAALHSFCLSVECGSSCPLYEKAKRGSACYVEGADIETNYEIVFGGSNPVEPNSDATIENFHEDLVNHPKHYETGKFECIDVMLETQGKESVEEYCLCAAFKYLYRHKRKNGIEDIKKARWYLDKYLELKDG